MSSPSSLLRAQNPKIPENSARAKPVSHVSNFKQRKTLDTPLPAFLFPREREAQGGQNPTHLEKKRRAAFGAFGGNSVRIRILKDIRVVFKRPRNSISWTEYFRRVKNSRNCVGQFGAGSKCHLKSTLQRPVPGRTKKRQAPGCDVKPSRMGPVFSVRVPVAHMILRSCANGK